MPNGPYNPKFKQGFAHFARKAASLRQARPVAQAFLPSIGLDGIQLPARFVLLLVLGANGGDAASMALARRCFLELHMEDWVIAVSDNTNSVSGTGTGQGGGAFFLMRRGLKFTKLLPRMSCFLHVLHVAYTHSRPFLMGGPLPSKIDRETEHPWNFLLGPI